MSTIGWPINYICMNNILCSAYSSAWCIIPGNYPIIGGVVLRWKIYCKYTITLAKEFRVVEPSNGRLFWVEIFLKSHVKWQDYSR